MPTQPPPDDQGAEVVAADDDLAEDAEVVEKEETLPWFSTAPAIAGSVALTVCGGTAIVAGAYDPAPEAWAAIAAWLTLMVAVGAAVVTLHQVEIGRRQRREDELAAHDRMEEEGRRSWVEYQRQRRMSERAQQEAARAARDLERERVRPYIVVYCEPNARSRTGAIDLVIQNTGLTPAFDVRVEFDPHPQTTIAKPTEGGADFVDLNMPTVIPVLAPGQEWRVIWDTLHRREQFGIDRIPSTTRAVATFAPANGAMVSGAPFAYELDIESWRRTTIEIADVHDVAEALDKLVGEVKKWRATDSQWRRS